MSGRTVVVTLPGHDTPIAVTVLSDDGEHATVQIDGIAHVVAMSPMRDGGVALHHDGVRHRLDVRHDGSHVELLHGSRVVLADVQDERDTWLAGGAGSAAQSAVTVAMPGKVVAIDAQVGDTVKKGDRLLVIEAMKMENPVRAPRDGVVRAVLVTVGAPVEAGTTLVELD